MKTAVSDLTLLLRSMAPVLNEGVYVYSSVPADAHPSFASCVALLREPEGVTVITSEAEAARLGLPVFFRAAWITLTVHSDLNAVGLTAAFASALGRAGISCNVVAGAYHDHLFVPLERAEDAMRALRELQLDAARGN